MYVDKHTLNRNIVKPLIRNYEIVVHCLILYRLTRVKFVYSDRIKPKGSSFGILYLNSSYRIKSPRPWWSSLHSFTVSLIVRRWFPTSNSDDGRTRRYVELGVPLTFCLIFYTHSLNRVSFDPLDPINMWLRIFIINFWRGPIIVKGSWRTVDVPLKRVTTSFKNTYFSVCIRCPLEP